MPLPPDRSGIAADARPLADGALADGALADGVAVSVSLACLLHCLALPLIAVGLPVLGTISAHHGAVHWVLLAIAVPLGLWALGRGRRRAGPWPLALGATGLGLMALGVGVWHFTPAETVATVIGASMVAAAHIANWRAATA